MERRRALAKRWIFGEFSLRRVMTGAVFVYACLAAFGALAGGKLLYQPHPAGYVDDERTSKLAPAGGAPITARFEEALAPRRGVALYSHGNAEDLGDIGPLLVPLRRAGLDVLAYDYEGYGTSGGSPSEARLEADVLAAYRHLVDERHVDPRRIVVYGRSLGSGPSVWLASTHPVGALVLESGFTSPFRVVTRARLFPFDSFPNLERIASVRCPVLIVHAEHDGLVPWSHGRALFEAAREPKRAAWMAHAGHADIPFADAETYEAALGGFVDSIPR